MSFICIFVYIRMRERKTAQGRMQRQNKTPPMMLYMHIKWSITNRRAREKANLCMTFLTTTLYIYTFLTIHSQSRAIGSLIFKSLRLTPKYAIFEVDNCFFSIIIKRAIKQSELNSRICRDARRFWLASFQISKLKLWMMMPIRGDAYQVILFSFAILPSI